MPDMVQAGVIGMPVIHVENDGVTFEVAMGEQLMDAIERHSTSIVFGCRRAGCGVCQIRVKQGMDNLNEPTHEESQLLAALGVEVNLRLCCQVKVFGDAVIEIAE